MADHLNDLLAAMEPDPWRRDHAFSSEVGVATRDLLSAQSDEERSRTLSQWLQKYQPCLFGRLAAKRALLTYCFLTEADFANGDQFVRDKIQSARLDWTRAGYEGRNSGFVLLVVSERLASALPNATVAEFARRLCSLYLVREIQMDQVFHDEIFLEKPGSPRTTWKWLVGANYFSAHADGRWWNDHRIPGGAGFSMNSVGHMVKSELLSRGLQALDEMIGEQVSGRTELKVESLGTALEFLMRTIAMAAETLSGKATELLPIGDLSSCPFPLPQQLRDKNYREYGGYYHTDFTLPSEYFRDDVSRPMNISQYTLDFTYLFENTVENPDHQMMGLGRRIREVGGPLGKFGGTMPREVAIGDEPLLRSALGEQAGSRTSPTQG